MAACAALMVSVIGCRSQKTSVADSQGIAAESYVSGLMAALRQAPDVILVGEMRKKSNARVKD